MGRSNTDIPLPSYATEGSAGMDLRASVESDVTILSGESALIPTGIAVEIPRGFEGQVRPRSGLAVKFSVGVLNSPGTIDSDYRGEIKVLLMNFGRSEFIVHRSDRIAQLVVAPIARVAWTEVDSVQETARGEGGFGHTGR